MKSIMISAPSSGSGKTIITLGIVRALKKRGLNVCCYKTGPDYIDKKFLELASGSAAGNLDIHLMGMDGIERSLSMGNGEVAVVEGAMGYFDGIYNTFENSSYDISRKLNINTILVYTPKGEMFSAIPKIKGMVDFQDSNIVGVILNKVRKDIYALMKEQIEKYIGVKVLGFVEEDRELKINSRHLGLVQGEEIENIDELIEKASVQIENNVDLDSLIASMSQVATKEYVYPTKRDVVVAIAYDKAFSFYYRENLNLFENTTEVAYFSPIKDKQIPKCDLLYLGGGYPEVFSEFLSKNIEMRKSIKKFAESGGHIYAECGGFMYLMSDIEGHKMCGVFNGTSKMIDKLQRFGYINIELMKDCILGKKGDVLTGHEFHKSMIQIDKEEVYSITKPMSSKRWNCGYIYKNVLAGYPHINFLGNMNAFLNLLDIVEKEKLKCM
ncbi:cobyrinate a,c-diamide synthase [Sporanaerobacter acetigenes]|uniref:cobyrinate a,c-diamide synthase n=1 Tax=Sporanaerobacter acetigenes TaxID=165813 RepID=UPI00104B83DF|nr:cobyrinate a,c-diamide synthase [Sporanaerobacter acetigenes]